MPCKSPFERRCGGLDRRAEVAVVPQLSGSAPDGRMQFRGHESRAHGPHDLCQFLPLSQDGNRLNYRDPRLRERMAAIHAFFVFDNLRCQVLLAHRHDHVMGKFRPLPHVVDERVHL